MKENQRSPIQRQDALDYHRLPRPGKVEVVPTKPLSTEYDLARAYSPGVAEPCRAIAADPDDAYRYTAKRNLVAVVSNGTAVLGLGAIGAAAAKPVMEGKAVLFKRFAGIDVFDLEIDTRDPEELIRAVSLLEPTFGGINLEDIAAPECFAVERELKARCAIPVMHDDQHGTAIITGAALLNAAEITERSLEEIRVVVIGAGAAAIATSRFYVRLGVRSENLVMFDVAGMITTDRSDLNSQQMEFAASGPAVRLRQALYGADVLLGLSAGNIVTTEDVAVMARRPIIFALANPDPEIDYHAAIAARPDAIIATGRSNHPNQVNNVLGFPYIFRGALDVGARGVTEEMKIAATHALAELAKAPVPMSVRRAYAGDELQFGPTYLIPKPLDPRLLTTVAPAVARAAMDSGVARYAITDWEEYDTELLSRVGIGQKLVSGIIHRARSASKRVVFAEADDYNVLKAAQTVKEEGIASPVLLGPIDTIRGLIEAHRIRSLDEVEILDPTREEDSRGEFARVLYQKRKRKGVTLHDALRLMDDRNYFGVAMVERGRADAFVSGQTKEYPKIIRPALHIIGTAPGVRRVAGMYIVNSPRGAYFFADTTVNLDPSASDLVDIIGLTARMVRFFDIEPRVAVLSYSNFGSTRSPEAEKCAEAVRLAKEAYPELTIDGELQGNIAVNQALLRENYPFSDLAGDSANTLIFPNLAAGNIAYKLLHEIGGAEIIGPVLMGMARPVQVLQLGSSAREIVNMAALAVVEAQKPAGPHA